MLPDGSLVGVDIRYILLHWRPPPATAAVCLYFKQIGQGQCCGFSGAFERGAQLTRGEQKAPPAGVVGVLMGRTPRLTPTPSTQAGLSRPSFCSPVSGRELKGQLVSLVTKPAVNNVYICDSDKPAVLEESLLRSVYK